MLRPVRCVRRKRGAFHDALRQRASARGNRRMASASSGPSRLPKLRNAVWIWAILRAFWVFERRSNTTGFSDPATPSFCVHKTGYRLGLIERHRLVTFGRHHNSSESVKCHSGRPPPKRSPRRRSVTAFPRPWPTSPPSFQISRTGEIDWRRPSEDKMIDEREGMSIIYVVFMTAVILALVIFFGLRSRYTANRVSLG